MLLQVIFIYCIIQIEAGHYFLSDEYINEINNKQSLWKAGRNFPPSTSRSYLRSLLGVNKQLNVDLSNIETTQPILEDVVLPEQFDPREKWPECASLKTIYDQSSCGSCWAVSATSAMTDRLCIHSNGTDQRIISAANLMTCCQNQYSQVPRCGDGCQGGRPFAAWIYWQTNGIVTGGHFNTSGGCQNYPFPPCRHIPHPVLGNYPNCEDHYNPTPECRHTCDDSSLDYSKELTFASQSYLIDMDKPNGKETELFINGPVVAEMAVFEDFYNYKSGIYKRTSANYIGDHAIRLLGWGTENNVSFWLAANSWNDGWGDNGVFKILRGVNECGFELTWTTGIPKLT